MTIPIRTSQSQWWADVRHREAEARALAAANRWEVQMAISRHEDRLRRRAKVIWGMVNVVVWGGLFWWWVVSGLWR